MVCSLFTGWLLFCCSISLLKRCLEPLLNYVGSFSRNTAPCKVPEFQSLCLLINPQLEAWMGANRICVYLGNCSLQKKGSRICMRSLERVLTKKAAMFDLNTWTASPAFADPGGSHQRGGGGRRGPSCTGRGQRLSQRMLELHFGSIPTHAFTN